jgi:hypothetical protein
MTSITKTSTQPSDSVGTETNTIVPKRKKSVSFDHTYTRCFTKNSETNQMSQITKGLIEDSPQSLLSEGFQKIGSTKHKWVKITAKDLEDEEGTKRVEIKEEANAFPLQPPTSCALM